MYDGLVHHLLVFRGGLLLFICSNLEAVYLGRGASAHAHVSTLLEKFHSALI